MGLTATPRSSTPSRVSCLSAQDDSDGPDCRTATYVDASCSDQLDVIPRNVVAGLAPARSPSYESIPMFLGCIVKHNVLHL